MKAKTTLTLIIFYLSPLFTIAQNINFHWAKHSDARTTFALDQNEFPYAAFSFSSAINVGNETIQSMGGDDILIQKQDPYSNEILDYYHLASPDDEQLASLDFNENGDLFIAGEFSQSLDMDLSDTEEYIINSFGSNTKFLSKYNSDMDHQWSVTFGDADYLVRVKTFNDKVLVGGSFEDNLKMINSEGVESNLPLAGRNSFLICFNAMGKIDWIDTRSMELLAFFTSITVKENLIYYTVHDIHATKIVVLNSNGTTAWTMPLQNAGAKDLKIDADNFIYITGNFDYFFGGTDFDPSPNTFLLEGVHSEEIFIAKYTITGEFIWAIEIVGQNIDTGTSLSIGHNDDIYLTGCIHQDADFDPSEEEYILNAWGLEDIFVANYSKEGALNWVEVFGGSSSDVGFKIVNDNKGFLWLHGRFYNQMDFDLSDDNEFTLEEGNNNAGYFFAKYDDCNVPDCITSTTIQPTKSKLKIYPNPANDYLIIESPDLKENTKLYVYDLCGKIVLDQAIRETSNQLNISTLPPGMYIYKIQNETQLWSDSFIKLAD